MTESLQEYESQLADVVALLEESPDDEGLQSLKADLKELIAITQQSQNDTSHGTGAEAASFAAVVPSVQHGSVAAAITAAADKALADALGETNEDDDEFDHNNPRTYEAQVALPDAQTVVANKAASSKKAISVSKEFEVPSGLVVLDTDTDAEKARKYRAIKSLKTKWRAKKKELETDQKQKSWQSFQKKKKSTTDKSMFATSTERDTKVGVVSVGSRQLTSGGQRKRHKHM
jgi:survival-of-motor-neuron-related-splicing factor 30